MPEAMEDCDGRVSMSALNLADDFFDLFFRHRTIRIIKNRFDSLSFMAIANHTLEQHVGAVGGTYHIVYQCRRVDWIIGEKVQSSPPGPSRT